MSRHGYVDEWDDTWATIRWQGAVKSAIRGKRGQALLREMLAALDAMPEKWLAAESLVTAEGEYCALGVLGKARGLDIEALDPDDCDAVALAFGISPTLVREIVYTNDEAISDETSREVEICGPVRPMYPDWGRKTKLVWEPNPHAGAQRWHKVRQWVASQIKEQ